MKFNLVDFLLRMRRYVYQQRKLENNFAQYALGT